MKLKPLGNRVLLKPILAEEKTKSGIYIPESAKEKPVEAEVVAVGNGKDVVESGIKPGNKVIHESYGGSEVKINGEKHILMEIKDVLAIVE